MSGVLIENEFGVRKATRQVDRVAAGHHLVVIAIRHQNRVMNSRQIDRRLTPPGTYGLQLCDKGGDRNRLVAVFGALFQPYQEFACRPAAVTGLGEDELVFRVPEGQRTPYHVADGA